MRPRTLATITTVPIVLKDGILTLEGVYPRRVGAVVRLP
jgi:hypothetical protein